MRGVRRVLWGAAAAAAVALALVASLLFERVEEVRYRGYRGEAAVHPYYALKQLFQRLGVATRTVSDLRRLPPIDHVLWVAAPSRQSTDRLVDWAAGGGHLVVVPTRQAVDPLLQALGVERFAEDDADEDDAESRPELASERPRWPRLFAHEGTEVLAAEGAPDAAWVLRVRVGRGVATVLSDGAFLHNDALGRLDHALIAWNAALHEREPAAMWLLYRDPRPSIWVLMTARAWPIAISLAVLVAAGLAALARRFGPRLEAAPRERRQLAEHVAATGAFLWRIGCEDTLLAAERRALGRRLGRGRRGDLQAPAAAELKVLAERAATAAGVDRKSVFLALALGETRDRHKFTRTIHLLEQLRRSA